jgi:acyl dehydratase
MSEHAGPSAGDLEVGDTAPELVLDDVSRKDFVMYAGASGDFNPIHYDEPLTKAAGNSTVFAQGMFTMGVASTIVADWFDLDNVREFSARFRNRVFPGDEVTATGVVTEVAPDGREVEAELEARNQDGDIVLTGRAVAELPRAGEDG